MNNIEDIYILSPMQKGMFFSAFYVKSNEQYFQQHLLELRGHLDQVSFRRAWQSIVERHTILRSSFHWKTVEEPLQVVHREAPIPWRYYDWRDLGTSIQKERLESLLRSDRQEGFDLDRHPLIRCKLLHLSEDTYKFVWSHHHILTDGWSNALILTEIFTIYRTLVAGKSPNLPPPVSYREYIAWLEKQDAESAEGFWRQTLAGITAPTSLTVETPADSGTRPSGSNHLNFFPQNVQALNYFARQNHVTLNTLIQGAWAYLLSRYSGESDILFGTVVSGRPTEIPDVESIVGLFINTLPVRVKVSLGEEIVSWLSRIQSCLVRQDAYKYSSLVDIHGWSDVPRGVQLFESVVIFENYPIAEGIGRISDDLYLDNISSVESAPYPLILAVMPGSEFTPGSPVTLRFSFDSSRFSESTIRRMHGHFQTILNNFIANPRRLLGSIDILSPAEHQQINSWNNGSRNQVMTASPNSVFHRLFEDQVDRTPSATAVTFDGQKLTYRELNSRANQLARHLRTLELKPDARIGLCIERSLDMIVGLLGIIKAGGAYVPLDPSYPEARLKFMIESAQVSVLVTQSSLTSKLSLQPERTTIIDTEWDTISCNEVGNLETIVSPEDLVYVMFTSGTTGQPKGVEIQHNGLCNLAMAQISAFNVQPTSRVLQFASLNFDASISEIAMALCSGSEICLSKPDHILPGPALLETLKTKAITHVTLPPSVLSELPHDPLPDLQCLIVAGEPCPSATADAWASGRRFYNAYGPTEATVCATIFELRTGFNSLPIGRPISNIEVYILDGNLNPTPVGVLGELYIGGIGLARGYMNDPVLTAEKFILYSHSDDREPQRLFKTGDLARFLPDGNIEFRGRLDNQIKLRGIRVELSEIEAALESHAGVKNVVVLPNKNGLLNTTITAFVTTTGADETTPNDMMNFLRDRLPAPLIPSFFLILDRFPLLPNGKVDHQALFDFSAAQNPEMTMHVGPGTPTEHTLANIWLDVLQPYGDEVSVTGNFFELGGHSFKAAQMISRIRTEFEIVLSLDEFFSVPTIAGIAVVIDKRRSTFVSHASITGFPSVDLEAEAYLDPTIQLGAGSYRYNTKPSTIFLTGATGFLGRHILEELLLKTSANISCLVRAASIQEAKKRIVSELVSLGHWKDSFASRIIPVVGDLSLPLFGLSEQGYTQLSDEVDVIYHNGAWVNSVLPYRVLKPVNVDGTVEILKLSVAGKTKPLHFTSTLGVFSYTAYAASGLIHEDDNLSATGVERGYPQSKWVAERLVAEARNRGLPVAIYRPAVITGHSNSGISNTDDWLCRMIKGCIQIGIWPNLGKRTLNMTPVEYVSRALVYLSCQEASLGKNFHITNPVTVAWDEMYDWVRSFNYPIREVSFDTWLEELSNSSSQSDENAIYRLLPLFLRPDFASQTDLQFDSRNTRDGLTGTNIVCPRPDKELFNGYLSYFINIGFLNTPK